MAPATGWWCVCSSSSIKERKGTLLALCILRYIIRRMCRS